jgi:hypothetical protein
MTVTAKSTPRRNMVKAKNTVTAEASPHSKAEPVREATMATPKDVHHKHMFRINPRVLLRTKMSMVIF